ncbi:MFS transporter [Paenibacillus doosanensis]|uniref:Glucose/mannose transporter GlcP n=1 Tax=Paenibacillus konkukensis TaxID=2020716 RepID=A0ABY4RP99_9BACL|nr:MULTISPECIES: MFS transporter [Paenibacillus]MCS7463626.1 MFS transporter [Paenibacillus doosanensis]UQZ83152.1 Glucose/mannose transporter GlcP [Paenibacillus konkukensis]
MNKLIWIGCCFYLLIGFTSVVAAALLPELMAHYGRDYADGGNLIFAQFSGFLLGVVTQPWWSKRFGRIRMLSFTLYFIAIGYLAIGLLPPWPVVLLTLPLVGFGSGMIESTVGALIIDAIEDKKAVAMSRLEVFFGAGALLMPVLISLLIAVGRWELTFFLTCLFAVLLSLIWRRYSSVNRQLLTAGGASHESGSSTAATAPYRGSGLTMLVCCIVVFFIYVGLEMSIVNFLPSILLETMKVDTAVASLSVSFFWATMVLGRLVCGVLAEKYGYTRYLLLCSIATVLTLIGFAVSDRLAGAFVMILLIGLFMSGLFSITLIFSNSLFPGQTERTTSKLIASSGIGGAAFSWLTGRFMEQAPISFTLWFLVALGTLLVLMLFVISRMKPRHSVQYTS